MKILFYDMGSYLYDDALEALKDLGHEVRTVYYHFDNRYEDDFFRDRFERKIREIDPEVILSINFFPLVARLAHDHGLIYVSWSCDSPLAEGLEEYFDLDTNRIWLFDRMEVETYRGRGHSRVYYSPLAVNVKRLSKLLDGAVDDRYRCDVSFVGSLYNSSLEGLLAPLDDYLQGYVEGLMQFQMLVYGADLLTPAITDEVIGRINERYDALAAAASSADFSGSPRSHSDGDKADRGDAVLADGSKNQSRHLNKKGLAFAIQKQITFAERVTLIDTLGSICDTRFYSTKDYPFESSVRFMGPVKYHDRMPYVFAASRLNLCPTLRSIVSGIPLRSLDILACGGVLLSNYQPELAEYFTDGEDLIMYSSLEDAVDKAQWYLSNEDVRAAIAGHAMPVLERDFDYKDRLSRILEESLK